MASIENREGKCSRTGCSAVPVNAPAARSTNAARCTEAEAARWTVDS